MDVTAENFWEFLPNIMLIISSSDYVALDMEMTGIQMKSSASQVSVTMEQLYERVKLAASTFQAVQLGITCLRWTGAHYQSFTFTIPITPMFHDDSREARKMAEIIDRRLTLSYSSLLFLRRHGFDLAKVLGSGASYLGRNDLEEVMAQMLQDRNYERVDPAGLGETAVKFYAELQEELTKWLDGLPKEGCIFRVFEPHGGTIRRSTVQMVQQLVREDFPTCRCWRDRDGWAMNIEVTDLEAEDKFRADSKRRSQVAIGKQMGLMWIIEALLSNSELNNYLDKDLPFPLHEIDHCIASALDLDITKWPGEPQGQWSEIVRKLQRHKPFLIGHNFLYDLCFLHSMFIGKLPESLEGFAQQIHHLLPRIIDTKLLVTQTVDSDILDQSLDDIFANLGGQSYPFVGSVVGWCYNKHSHSRRGTAHDAGFDSYMTANIFLKLASRQMHLQKELLDTQSSTAGSSDSTWMQTWVVDPDDWDPYLQSSRHPDCPRLPNFRSSFFKPVRNKLRMSSAGIMDLEHGRNPLAVSGPDADGDVPKKDAAEHEDILSRLKGEVDKLQMLIGNRVAGWEDVEGIKGLCEALGCLTDEIGKKHSH